ncbi:MAG: hypothetical protein ACRCWB_11850 [Enterovibrio sp.]
MIKDTADIVSRNAEKILGITQDERKILASIKDLGKKIYLSNSATISDVEIITSRALALLSLMRDRKK